VPRALVSGQEAVHVCEQLLGRDVARALDHRGHDLPEPRVWGAEHHGVGDGGVGQEGFLDLERVDLLAAGVDDRAAAPQELDVPVVLD
jgi:hypothetical protein